MKKQNFFQRLVFGFTAMPRKSAPVPEKRRGGIKAFYEEGVYAQIWITLTSGKYLADLALFLGAAAIHLGFINAIPFFAASAQLLGARILSRVGSRKKVLLPAAFIARESWWLILAVLFLPVPRTIKLWIFISLLMISHVAGQISGNAWLSWLSDLLPTRMRGSIIAKRNGLLILVAIGADFFFSQVRQLFGEEMRFTSIVVTITVACIFGAKSIFAFQNQWEPPGEKSVIPSLGQVWKACMKKTSVRRLMVGLTFWNLAIGVPVSFWAPHMLTNLEMSFTSIFIYSSIVTVFNFIMSRYIWGPVIDKAGTLSVIVFCSLVISVIPLFWFFITADDLTLIWFEAGLNGLMWSGFNVAAFNMPFSVLPKKKRPHYFAMLATVSGLGLGLGALMGGVIAQNLQGMKFEIMNRTYVNYHVTFLISAILRLLCVLLLRRIPDSQYRGMVFMFQTMGDGLVRLRSNPRFFFYARLNGLKKKFQATTKQETFTTKP